MQHLHYLLRLVQEDERLVGVERIAESDDDDADAEDTDAGVDVDVEGEETEE